MLLYSCYAHHRGLHSFPTRRSSDLPWGDGRTAFPARILSRQNRTKSTRGVLLVPREVNPRRCLRSEEHTSELQSQSNLVCRLPLEKKNRWNGHTTTCPASWTRRLWG